MKLASRTFWVKPDRPSDFRIQLDNNPNLSHTMWIWITDIHNQMLYQMSDEDLWLDDRVSRITIENNKAFWEVYHDNCRSRFQNVNSKIIIKAYNEFMDNTLNNILLDKEKG